MQKFEHFIITRFNIKLKEWVVTKQGEDVTSINWLQHRFNLFETYCLPSIKQQTNLNFKWLVCFDAETPEIFKQKIKNLEESFVNFVPIYIENSTTFHDVILETIKSYYKAHTTHIITSRLDNDDSLHQNYIETIQNNFTPKASFIIDVINGYQLNLKTHNTPAIREIETAFNPFISLIEGAHNCVTVLNRKHLDWHTNPHKTIADQPLWMQVIHKKNISNSEKLHFREVNTIAFSNFGITKQFELKSNVNIALSNMITNFKRLFLKLKLMKS
ncbi:glycosyltransferase [Psychroserpens damuponensis]|uniref:glycosyltransferase n=1 Tax=Psychroserpens damuponensis TaxID=943936 RepID=UPI0006946442|nr:glycosyltransferase [Psychroserpens damuponensis]